MLVSANASAQIIWTARHFLAKADSISLLYAHDAMLDQIGSINLDTTGKASSWTYFYHSHDSVTVYTFVGQNDQVTFYSSYAYSWPGPSLPSSWIDSDSALSIAQRAIGSATVAQFPTCKITALLIASLDSTIRWVVSYQCSDNQTRLVQMDATTGDTLFTKVTADVKRIGNTSSPADFSLFQNYPNPFNPATKITFTIPRRAFVTLAIYDLGGKEIALPVSGSLSAGVHSIIWDASSFSSGTYFCRLQSGQLVTVKKMLLLK